MQLKEKEYYEKLEQGVQTILEGDKVKEFLRSTAMFRKYSLANAIMIYCQKPGASRVAGMLAWNRLGRRAKKGEKGIAIFAPLISRNRKKSEAGETEEAVAQADGTISQEDGAGESRLRGFKVVYVYDVSQTDGRELPQNAFATTTAAFTFAGDAAGLFQELVKVCPVPVTYGEWDGAAKGYYMPHAESNSAVILLHKGLTDLEKPKVLLHEWAHHVAIVELKENTMQLADRPAGEVIAEGAAFVVSSCLGLDTTSYSFNYVAAWGQDIKMILTWGNAVKRVASRIIEALEETGRESDLQRAA